MPRRLPPRLDENRKKLAHILSEQYPPIEIIRDGLCVGSPLNFYSSDPLMRRAAQATCEECPVRERCLEWSLWTLQTEGIWGGRSDMERRRALSVDTHGRFRFMLRGRRCPNCKSTDLVTAAKKYMCTECEMTWPVIRPRRGQTPPPWYLRAVARGERMNEAETSESVALVASAAPFSSEDEIEDENPAG
jgi:hypothetical protein